MYPEYSFVFNVERNAIAYWGYPPEAAKAAQLKMLEIVCAQAKKKDSANGVQIIIPTEWDADRHEDLAAPSACTQ